MKKRCLCLFLFCQTYIAICQTVLVGKVVRIADGDTITILDRNNKQIRVRFYGIDCPESHQDYGSVARKFTADHCFKKTVEVEVKDVDRYGRTVGMVILSDGTNLNKELLKAGLAWHYTYFDKSQEFAALEDYAETNFHIIKIGHDSA
ncbi:thermonuclease family protein [Olivibacter sp. XZL3]|uniref:thermonuclease family protein n=1 Tax=Olivibacter sp. XZL3 TaxID=1735116 RepID=UPI001065E2E2|nr:thermonuclease family protein [Olivibacter sp. XZL3]